MTCRDFIEFLLDYLQGEVTPEERRVFDEHLQECVACRHYLATYQQTIALVQAAGNEQDLPRMPAELQRAILAARAMAARAASPPGE